MDFEISQLMFLLVALFLPLFPLSIVFNFLLKKIRAPLLKIAVAILWPFLGLALYFQLNIQISTQLLSWLLGWAVFTSVLYAYRLLAQRGINTWTGFLATSIWSLFWIPLIVLELNITILSIYLLGFGVPLAIIYYLAGVFKKRFRIAYTNLHGGVATTMPRFSGLLVVTIFAAIATPVFPSFFIMIHFIIEVLSEGSTTIALMLLLIWFLWSWAGVRIIQGLLVGSASQQHQVKDLHNGLTWGIGIVLVLLALAGLFITGGFI